MCVRCRNLFPAPTVAELAELDRVNAMLSDAARQLLEAHQGELALGATTEEAEDRIGLLIKAAAETSQGDDPAKVEYFYLYLAARLVTKLHEATHREQP